MKKKFLRCGSVVSDILKEASDLCVANRLKHVNLESVVLTTIKHFLKGDNSNKYTEGNDPIDSILDSCCALECMLKDLGAEKHSSLIKDLEEEFRKSIERDKIIVETEDSGIPFCLELQYLTEDFIKEAAADIPTDDIEVVYLEEFWRGILLSLDCVDDENKLLNSPGLTEILEKYDLTIPFFDKYFDKLVEDCGTNKFDLDFLGNLKRIQESLSKSIIKEAASNTESGSSKVKAIKIKKGNELIDFDKIFPGLNLKTKSLGYEDPDKNKKKTSEEIKEEFDELDKEFEAAGIGDFKAITGKDLDKDSPTPNLDQFSVDMIAKARSGKKYDPVIGREKEIQEIIRVLECRLCNNPMLLGDPGCGKTAIVEHLAELIATDSKLVPDSLKKKRLFNLDINAVVAGCMYRGQFEERMQNIVKEVVNSKDIIVYIDEIHNMIGAGAGQQDKGDMANILKPFLSRGEFQCIGSTTTAEFRKVIEKDKALVRRFEPIFIEEPTIEDTKTIIKGLASKYEEYHKVKFDKEALESCVDWSDRYIYGSYFPAKAIKIMDKAGANVKIDDHPLHEKEIKQKELRDEIDNLNKEKVNIVLNDFDNWNKADEIKEKVDKLEKTWQKNNAKLESTKETWPKVKAEDVCKVISSSTGVPLDKIKSTDMDKVREMKSTLDSKVIGQEEAIEELSIALQQNMLGLRDPKKPIASFLFVGPTGVGKTFVSKTVAKEFFGSEKNLVTIACSEYMQDWAESKLLGSAPGYVGYDSSEPRLYILKRQPYTVLLIDEVEKSSKNLYNIWLNMLEEGEITLSSGEKISCRNCIIIFTGNVGTKSLEIKGNGIGFGNLEGEEKKKADVATVMKEVEKEFRPEFLNRLSKVVVFNSLEKNDLDKIFDLEFKDFQKQIKKESNLSVSVTKRVKDLVISKCEPKYGARSLKRFINEYIQKEICKAMLKNNINGKCKVSVDLVEKDKVEVSFK